ncbi:MAG TPA: potassium/proton antiporter [Solirubrobacteraceae bacterium]|nr:potassium/proton antiporter [Solirubrobacteraceae bacterium]
MTDAHFILAAGALLAGALVASFVAWRLRIPGLVLFLGVGMLVGSDGLGWLEFSDYALARRVGTIALVLILFEGGLTAGFAEIRPVFGSAVSLALLGTLGTALVVGLFATLLFDFSTLQGLLLGSIVASTDGAAVLALLRGSTLRRKLARTLEGEAGFNDPVAVVLVLGLIEWITDPHYGVADMVTLVIRQLGIGIVVGVGVGWVAVWALKRIRLATGGLFPVVSLAVAALAYGGAASIDGSGFLAVYLSALVLGSAAIPAKRTITAFHEGLAWVAQLAMFVVLGLLVLPSQLGDVALEGTALALVLMFVARPAATWLATALGDYSAAERLVLGWAGLRGAVPVVLATFPVIAHVPHSLQFFNIVFFAVVLSALVQGASFEPLARRLGLTSSEPALPRPLADSGTIHRLGAEVLEYPVADDDAIVGRRVRDLGLPRDALVNVIVRGEDAIPPRGSTRLRAGDVLHVLTRVRSARGVQQLTERWHSGPVGPPPRPARRILARRPVFSTWPWGADEGDPGNIRVIRGQPVVEQLRIRRDEAGGLWYLADGRYAATGRRAAIGGRDALTQWAIRRLRHAGADERAWLQTVVGALAADRHEAAASSKPSTRSGS